MRAYYFDPSAPGDQRAPHDSGRAVSLDQLKSVGAAYWHIPVENGQEEWEGKIDEVARERGGTRIGTLLMSVKRGWGRRMRAS